MTLSQRWTALSDRWEALFRDHEIIIRTGGEVRFIHLYARVQRRVANIAVLALGAWLLVTLALLGWQAHSAWQQRDVDARRLIVERAEARVASERSKVENVARDLGSRLDYLEALNKAHFGETKVSVPAEATAGEPATPTTTSDKLTQLQAIRQREQQIVAAMTAAVTARSAKAEAALRAVGIRPGNGAQGGPFVPFPNRVGIAAPRDPAIARLTAAFGRMETLEALVLAIPSVRPAEVMRLSSGFGYRRDPFTGAGAMHAGLDFTGAHGSPIHAAAAGRVAFVGQRSGYGNVVEIDHGHGIMTRYAHLSGFASRVGQAVQPGQTIARMGSTGRSTGTHLHFEVRVGGAAVNPRRFLEANQDVLEIQADAGQRARTRIGAR